MAAAAAAAEGAVVLSKPVTFVSGNVKKLEEVREILGNSIPFRSLRRELPGLKGEPEGLENRSFHVRIHYFFFSKELKSAGGGLFQCIQGITRGAFLES